jgi:hypothetical protein
MRRLLPGLLLATLPSALAAQDAHGLAYSAAFVIDSGGHKNTVHGCVAPLFAERGNGHVDGLER